MPGCQPWPAVQLYLHVVSTSGDLCSTFAAEDAGLLAVPHFNEIVRWVTVRRPDCKPTEQEQQCVSKHRECPTSVSVAVVTDFRHISDFIVLLSSFESNGTT